MKKSRIFVTLVAIVAMVLIGCQESSPVEEVQANETKGAVNETASEPDEENTEDYDTIIMVWYPNESGEDLKNARDEMAKIVEKATGKKVEHKLTTDYAIAIETLVNGNAHMGWMGAEGYIQAHNKNDKLLPIAVNSGKSGTLDDAKYHSWLSVRKEDQDEYKEGDSFTIDPIQGKKFSFVSNSSTSGFKVPSAGITAYFSKKDEFKDLTQEDLLEGGEGQFFQEVLYGGSHQGSAVNLLSGNADVAAFCDSCVANYVELSEGEENKPGAIYHVKEDAEDPFTEMGGQEFTVISVTPVLNAPFVANTQALSQADYDKIVSMLTSDEVANNEKIFVPKDSEFVGFFSKKDKERFIQVEDSWFNPIRELSE